MKKISRIALVNSIILLVIDIAYVMKDFQTMNILHFLSWVILLPCVLISVMIASMLAEIQFKKMNEQAITIAILGAMISVIAFVVAGNNQNCIENIVKNSKKMTESTNLSISDISINNDFSSFFFIFIIIFVLSMGFSILLNILQERRKGNVSEQE